MLAAAALPAATVFSLNTGTATAAPTPIKHIVVLYLENHTFDSILGFWCNANPGRCPDGGMPASVHLSNGATVTPTVGPDVVPGVDHSVAAQVAAMDGGKMDGWWKVSGCAPSTGYACISGYTAKQQPNTTALATKFAISDETFSLKDSPSWGGHMYAAAATTDGFTGDNPTATSEHTAGPGWGCDSFKETQWSATPTGTLQNIPSCVPYFKLGTNGGAFESTPASHVPTIMDRLDGAGLSWKIYAEPTPSGGGYGWDVCPTFADCLDTTQSSNNVPAPQILTDAAAGKLPSFSLITPGGTDAQNSEHNGNSMTKGDNWIGQIASALMKGPEWSSTALFITWDDCGCFYDQVPPKPPLNPDMTPRGPRTPLIIVSPYARPGFTDTNPTTFGGILAFVEKTFGLTALGVNDAGAYDFSGAFNFAQAPLQPVHMVNRPVPPGEHINLSADNQDT